MPKGPGGVIVSGGINRLPNPCQMRWVARTEKDTANKTLEKRLWDAADQFRANSGLKAVQPAQ